MTIIGLTGGFGTGKSFVASVFKALGAEVIDADRLAANALKKEKRAYKRIVAAFGEDILNARGDIDRRLLGKKVFSDPKKVATINRIVHPEVIRDIKEAVRRSRKGTVVIDAPLLVEAGLAGYVDTLVVVKASRKNQIKRCTKKFGITPGDVLRRIRSQIPLKMKMRLADFVIDNNGTKSRTKKEAIKIWRQIRYGDS